MRIINIVEVRNKDVTVHSFVVEGGKLTFDVGEEAHERFTTLALENGCKEEEVDSYIEEGMYEHNNYKLFIKWSV